jgi:hypothetical protein
MNGMINEKNKHVNFYSINFLMYKKVIISDGENTTRSTTRLPMKFFGLVSYRDVP